MGIFPFPWSHLLGHPSSHHPRGNLQLSVVALLPLNYALLEDQLGHSSSPYPIASSLYQLLPQAASIFCPLKGRKHYPRVRLLLNYPYRTYGPTSNMNVSLTYGDTPYATAHSIPGATC